MMRSALRNLPRKVHAMHHLPPYHTELSPAEITWAEVKYHGSMNNKNLKTHKMEMLIGEDFANVTIKYLE
jgi:transposase